MSSEIINGSNISSLSKQISLFIKYNYSTIPKDIQKIIIKEDKNEEKLKLSHHTQNLLKKNEKINKDTVLRFEKTSNTNNQEVAFNQELAKYKNVDISTITKPLKYPIVLCHGLFGFDKRGPESIPFLQVHYWNRIQKYLEQLGCKVIIPKVAPAGGVKYRAHELNTFIKTNFPNQKVHLIAHSMGGLDCRYLISHIKPKSFKILTLTTLSTPHRGSPFMDWCRKMFGVGWINDPKHIPSAQASFMAKSEKNATLLLFNNNNNNNININNKNHLQKRQNFLKFFSKDLNQNKKREVNTLQEINSRTFNDTLSATSLLFNSSSSPIIDHYNIELLSELYEMQTSSYYNFLCRMMSIFDTPAYRILTTDFCNNIFNPLTPDDPEVMYQSYGASRKIPFINPLSISQQIIKKSGQIQNDGLVGVESAKWGKYKGTIHADHFDLNDRWSINLFYDRFNVQDFYYSVVRELYSYEEI
jgi:triacylglycerol esterase/lipase EstA (alpha/beta hydrolase family)